jgi:hypothetical protein
MHEIVEIPKTPARNPSEQNYFMMSLAPLVTGNFGTGEIWPWPSSHFGNESLVEQSIRSQSFNYILTGVAEVLYYRIFNF